MKIVVEEDGSDAARAFAEQARSTASSPIAYVEVRSAIARSDAQRRFATAQVALARRTLEAMWPEIAKVRISAALMASAGDVSERHGLRALDAVHVASAVRIAASAAEDVVFVSWDRDQRAGAAAERLALFPETL